MEQENGRGETALARSEIRESEQSEMKVLPLASSSDDGVDATTVLLTSRSAAALGFLTADLIMSRLGVYEPMATKELILRDEGLVGIQDACAQNLISLEMLSLSHNKLTTLQGFQYLSNLVELNLNFNQITSLQHLQCFGLEKLFLSNNRVADISPLKAFDKLNTLSLYGNHITDLEASLSTCRSLPKLRSLDLGGNPCSQEADGYKFQAVRFLPRLKILDGDQLTQLDKDLAEEFVVQGRPATADASRPSTATSIGSRPLTASRPWDADAPLMTPSKPFDAFASKHMPRGNVRLFRDDFLNNNPILMEYLAQETQETAPEMVGEQATNGAADFAGLQRSSSFVDKMRGANPLQNGVGSDLDHGDDGSLGAVAERPSTAGLSTGIGAVLTTNLGIDPSDPKSTIRKLLKHIELLEESLASYKTRAVEASEQAMMEENRRLQTENNNIPILQEQIATLKKQLSAAGGPRLPAPTSIGALGLDAKRANDVEAENEQLRREVTRLRQMLKNASEVASGEPTASTAESGNSRVNKPTRLGDSRLLEESASIDVELTELILQNEVSLEMIRNDIKNTKKEWEDQFQLAKQREQERQRARPQTSLGLLHVAGSSSTTPRFPGELADLKAAGASFVGKAKAKSGTHNRHIHTSAGFHHGSGPEERLLHSVSGVRSSAISNGRSVTNILTL